MQRRLTAELLLQDRIHLFLGVVYARLKLLRQPPKHDHLFLSLRRYLLESELYDLNRFVLHGYLAHAVLLKERVQDVALLVVGCIVGGFLLGLGFQFFEKRMNALLLETIEMGSAFLPQIDYVVIFEIDQIQNQLAVAPLLHDLILNADIGKKTLDPNHVYSCYAGARMKDIDENR